MANDKIFGKKFLSKKLKEQTKSLDFFQMHSQEFIQIIKDWDDLLVRGTVKDEESFQDPFIDKIFKNLLGYTRQVDGRPWTCTREYKTKGGKSVDATLGFYEKGSDEDSATRAVIELKAPTEKNLERKSSQTSTSAAEQAFDYATKIGPSCHWVIVSNMDEIRLYRSNDQKRFESFRIPEMAKDLKELERFYLLMCRENLLPSSHDKTSSFIDDLFAKNQADQAEINKSFYSDYSRARLDLFHAICEANPNTSKLDILEKTQTILDRFIFICFCEDRGFISESIQGDRPTEFILNVPKRSFRGSIWREFLDFSAAINDGADTPIKIPPYNGGLFKPDRELEKLSVPNSAFKPLEVIRDRDFESELDVAILGHIFEQSITDIDKMKAEIKGITFDKKKGERKRHGIYYTPPYITGFIVENCIDMWLDDRKKELGFDGLPPISEEEENLLLGMETSSSGKKPLPKELAQKTRVHAKAWKDLQDRLGNIKIVDPACGSGAFLNRALDYLVKKHNEIFSYLKHFGNSEWSLNALGEERIEEWIVTNNLFGVDLSKESVEITKLSLWLKIVQYKKPLPNLDENIKFGDSIISDSGFSENAFNWEKGFPKVFSASTTSNENNCGFDIVIGNPPYVRQEFLVKIKPYLEKAYPSVYNSSSDLYVYFYEKGFRLLRQGGVLGYITNSTFTKTSSGNPLRKYLKNNVKIEHFIDFGDLPVFGKGPGAPTNYPCVLIAKNSLPGTSQQIAFNGVRELPENTTDQNELFEHSDRFCHPQSSLDEGGWNFSPSSVADLEKKIFSKGRPLKDVAGEPLYGIKTGLNEAFIIDRTTRDRLIKEELGQRNKQPHPDPLLEGEGEFTDGLSPTNHPLIKPFLQGRDLKQWCYENKGRYLIFIPKGETRKWSENQERPSEDKAWQILKTRYPAIAKYLEVFEPEAKKRDDQGEFWWELRACAYCEAFEKPKIVYVEITDSPKFSMAPEGIYCEATSFFITSGDWWLLAILMSKIPWFCLTKLSSFLRGHFFRFKKQWTEPIPIVEPQGADREKLAQLAKMCQEMAFKRQGLRMQFLEIVTDELKQVLSTPSRKLTDEDIGEVSERSRVNSWEKLSWDEFCKHASSGSAFGKNFVTYTKNLLRKSRLKGAFEELKTKVLPLSGEIHKAEGRINEIVYKLYGLTPDEVSLLESVTGDIYED